MHSTGEHLIDLVSVREEDLGTVIVSQHGGIVISRYGDTTWNLAPYLAPKNSTETRIVFGHPFKQGYRLTDPPHATLLASVKRFLYTRWRVAGGHLGRPVSAGTIRAIWSKIRHVVSWMIDEGLSSFSELTPERCARYAARLAEQRQPGTVAVLLGAVTSYYDMREHLVDRMPDYPWRNTYGTPTGLARGGRRPRGEFWRQATTEVIPLPIMARLVQTALDYIENRAEPLLLLRDLLAARAKRKLQDVENAHRKAYPSGFASVCRSESEYLRVKASHRWTKQECDDLAAQGYQSRKQFQKELVHLRTACYIVCAAFSGMRDSELASLEVGCFVMRKSSDGETYCWLRGTTYKLEHEPRPAEWMVPEIVGKAVAIATTLGQPDRQQCSNWIRALEHADQTQDLNERARVAIRIEIERARRSLNALLLTGKRIGRYSAVGRDVARRSLQEFSRKAGIAIAQKDMEGVLRRDRVVPGGEWPFTIHQFRRTFAVYVARHVLGDVRYLREHFKHWSLDMTLYYARHDSAADRSLIGDILTERDELQALLVESWMQPNSPLAGKGGHRIKAFRNRGELKTVHNMRDFCRKLGENVFIRGTGHSWCMASGNGCGGQGLYDSVRCTSCGEAVIDTTHVQIWRGIRQQQIDVLQCPDLGEPAKQRCIDHLLKAERVLADLGEATPPFLPPAQGTHRD